ncbi:hypothetical protein NA57DRAFT_53754 [Rhizodiscina lignyota]|uniref:Uncharacterized protein n=1 Tax=Rhizodiscina lignyota TaxID=1504668 RepID=A0A9P4ILV4_9PEZI|nr:hypothetical protein NA57DRAFT_53754 [Rhizodiscina lignyota]
MAHTRANPTLDAPGDPTMPTSFLDCATNEMKLAYYLGYSDRADLRAFLFSSYWLPWWLLNRDMLHGHRCNTPFRILQECSIDQMFPKGVNAQEKWPVEKDDKGQLTEEAKMNRHYRVANLWVNITRSIDTLREKYPDGYAPRDKNVEELNSTRFDEALDKKLPIPLTDRIRLPVLPNDPAESSLENFNRIYMMFRFLDKLTTDSQWKTRQFNTEHVFASKPVSEEHGPSWMVKTKILNQPTLSPRSLAQKTFKILWKRKKNAPLEEHFDELDNAPSMPSTKQTCSADPRHLSGPEFRNSIRHQFSCRGLRMQIHRAVLDWDAGDDCINQINMLVDWEEAKTWFTDKPEESVTIELTFRPLGEGEELFESEEVP